jgi:hypothetical protein
VVGPLEAFGKGVVSVVGLFVLRGSGNYLNRKGAESSRTEMTFNGPIKASTGDCQSNTSQIVEPDPRLHSANRK